MRTLDGSKLDAYNSKSRKTFNNHIGAGKRYIITKNETVQKSSHSVLK